jgi:hypothetical protein
MARMRALLPFVVMGALITACAAETEPVPTPEPTKEVGNTTPPPAKEPTPAPKDPPKEEPASPKNECKLDAMSGVEDVTPSFVVYAMPNEVPLEMTGGTLSGQYAVGGAKVYLPSGAAGLVSPEESTGTINAWAVFDGTNYRLHLKADFTLASVQGPLSQGVDNESQGGFKTNAEVLLLDHECDAALDNEADYSFTDDGNGHATILVKTSTPYGDTYLQLDANKL